MAVIRPNGTAASTPSHPAQTHVAEAGGVPLIGDRLNLHDVLIVLRRHALLVLGAIAVSLALSASVVLRDPPKYRATAVIRVTDARRSIAQGIENPEAGQSSDIKPVYSQIELLKRRALVGAVVDSEGLRLRPKKGEFSPTLLTRVQIDPAVMVDSFTLDFSPAQVTVRNGAHETRVPYGGVYRTAGVSFAVASDPGIARAMLVLSPREKTIDAVLANLRASRHDETDVVDVNYVDLSPSIAQRVVNRLVTTFQDANIRAAQGQSRRRRLFLQEQLREIDAQLARAQGALTAFRTQQQLFSSRDKLQAQQAALMTLDMRWEELNADRRMYQSLLAKVQGPHDEQMDGELRALIAAPGLTANPVIAQLYPQLAQYQTARDSLTTGEWRSAAGNPDVARLDQLIKGTKQRLVGAVSGHVTTLDARLNALAALRARSAAATAALPRAESVEEQLSRQVDANRALADRLREEYQKARMAEVVEAGQVEIVDMAALPYLPLGRMRLFKLLLGLIVGAVVGTGGALLAESTSARIRRRVDLEAELQVPVLSIIPKIELPPADGKSGGGLARLLRGGQVAGKRVSANGGPPSAPMSAAGGEAFRLLRSSLKWTQDAESSRVLMVTSAMPQEGKTTTSMNLAAAFALEGRRVLLIDCDLHRTRLHQALRVPRDPGLAQVLRGYLPAAGAIRSTFVDGLWFLPAGRNKGGVADLLGSERMRSLLTALLEHFDVIVLDTPPVLAVADAACVAPLADGVLLVVRAGVTDRRVVGQAIRQLDSVGARVVGAVLNDSRGEAQRYGDYYNYSYAEQYAAGAE